ncbi:MAG: UvrD-helicase domain-containing protein [Eubacterium sp.]|nr:UvrD-helicase domain-containing protein [Eubacterium sp.]
MNYLETLNEPQKEAVTTTDGPVLILAGAGSGKTRALTSRIAYLIDEKKVRPWNIMAITFTNKAAGEMRERVNRIVGDGAEYVWVATFHSSCCRILRRYIDRIGYSNNFTIYDTDDSRTVIKRVMKELELDSRTYHERSLLSQISAAKNNGISPDEFEKQSFRWEQKTIAKAYRAYEAELKANNALDFDDLLLKTVELFESCPEVLEYYQDRLKYIMVDEYQDTNTVQFRFVSLLARKYHNLCVVGDDDQSIYKFRGADIRNILEFEHVYPDAKVIYLEQNYRSTQPILDAANAVISHNRGRKEKKLWTAIGGEEKARFRQFDNSYDEAEFVISEIQEKHREEGKPFSDYAILYRTNAQSRAFEEQCVARNIPYKIVGGINFYAHREIKDILAYLTVLENPSDDLAVRRIINVPKRGIGQTSIGKVEEFAQVNNLSFYEALERAPIIPGMKRAAGSIEEFRNLLEGFAKEKDSMAVSELIGRILEETGYRKELEEEGTDEAETRIENLKELISKASDYDDQSENPTLSDFLQQVSLVADIDSVEEGSDYVLLMTLHSAKGLEFDSVYMTGMEDGVFPGFKAITAEEEDSFDEQDGQRTGRETSEMEEERRLCYVGITRAKRHLTLTASQSRIMYGERQYYNASRFIHEIPRAMIDLGRDTTDTRRFLNMPSGDLGGLSRLLSGGQNGGNAAADSRKGNLRNADQASGYGTARGYGSAGYVYGGGNGPDRKKTSAMGKFKPKEFTVQKAGHLDYQVGDKVRHRKFGAGVVTEILDGKKDFEVTVDFENFGTRRMFASFAKLEKIS